MGFGAEAKEKVSRSEVMLKPIGINSIMDPEKSDEEILAEAETIELFGYKNLGIANVENNLNIREGADEGTKLDRKSVV